MRSLDVDWAGASAHIEVQWLHGGGQVNGDGRSGTIAGGDIVVGKGSARLDSTSDVVADTTAVRATITAVRTAVHGHGVTRSVTAITAVTVSGTGNRQEGSKSGKLKGKRKKESKQN